MPETSAKITVALRCLANTLRIGEAISAGESAAVAT